MRQGGVQGEGLEGVQVSRERGIRVDKTAAWVGGSHKAGSGTFVSKPKLVQDQRGVNVLGGWNSHRGVVGGKIKEREQRAGDEQRV